MHRLTALAIALSLAAPFAAAQIKQPRWSHPLDVPAHPAVIAGDLIPDRPGLEALVALEDPPRLRCVDAAGNAVWTVPALEGGRLSAPPAWSPGAAQIAVAGDSGEVRVIDAATGALRWTDTLTAPATTLIWARLDGDDTPTVLAAGGDTVTRWNASGAKLAVVALDGPVAALAAAPVRAGDGATLFAAAGTTLAATGAGAFEAKLPGAATTLAVGDLTDDGLPALVVGIADPPGVAAFDADRGDERWHTALPFAPEAMALGDLERDGAVEIIVAGAGGVAAIAADGAVRWIHTHDDGPAPGSSVLLADVDSDGVVDVLVAAPGRGILRIDAAGAAAPWRADPAPRGAPAMADTAMTRTLDLVLVDADGALRAFATGAFDTPALAPWTTLGGAPTRANALPPVDSDAPSPFVTETVAVLENGGFETAGADGAPAGWHAPEGVAARLGAPAMNGQHALEVDPGDAAARVESAPMRLDPAARSLLVTVFGKGEGARGAVVRWMDGDRVAREDRLRRGAENAQGWRRFTAGTLSRPAGADSAVLALESAPGAGPVWWDEASAAATLERIPRVEVHCNLLGYEEGMPKRFTASGTVAFGGGFEIVSRAGAVVFEGELEPAGRIVDPFHNDWGRFHAMGDFTAFNDPGFYRIRVRSGDLEALSPEFTLRRDLLWDETMARAAGFLRAHRTAEGWRVPGADAPLDAAAATLALAEAHSMLRWRFSLEDAPEPFLLDEALHGAEALMAAGGGGAARAAALARVAALAPDREDIRAAALAALEAAPEGDRLTFAATVDLALLTGDPALRAKAEARYPGVDPAIGEAILRYDELLDALDPASFDLALKLAEAADLRLRGGKHPFGVHAEPAGAGQFNFFGTTASQASGAGGNRAALAHAATVAAAYRFQPKPEYIAYVYDQFNWILGNNPEGISLVTGVGTPGIAGAWPAGGVAGGFTGRGPGDDRPALLPAAGAGEPGAPTLENTVAWIEALAHVKRVRLNIRR